MLKTLVTVALLLAAYAPFAHADQDRVAIGSNVTVSEGQTTNTVKGGMVMLNPGT